MDDFEKYLAICIITTVLGLVFMACFNTYQNSTTERIAIKQGLVQRVEQTKTIWVRP